MKTKIGLIIIVFMTISCTPKIKTGSDVIHLMKKTFNNSYLENFTFSQYISEYENGVITNQTIWHEAYSFPNQLIIKFEDFESGNGYVFNQDTVFEMQNNQVQKKYRDIHDLLIFAFEIYGQPYQNTHDKLTEKGYDLSKVCETTVNGRKAYCVGTEIETQKVNKFYIDKEKLTFIKMISYSHDRYGCAEFANYKLVKGKYIATKVLFYQDDQLIMTEEYFAMDFPETLNPDIFDPGLFKEAKW